ncbi:MAG: hypothetical protein VKP57_04085 [Candidatus Sericytochromatia bacterium]|nr:hypothetical protein [Candidatus Sericytochromatia bacterium]
MTRRKLLAALLVTGGLALATWSQVTLRDVTGPQVVNREFVHDAAGHTKDELIGVGAGIVMVLVGALLVI